MTISLPDVWHIEHLKITGYLLNIDHRVGAAKARVFLGFGFRPSEPDRLALALFDHLGTVPHRVVEGSSDVRFVFEGPLRAPSGIIPRLRSVWLMVRGDTVGRLVTAYPFDDR